jgi:4-amino-4-deoxy-L-arabinose transferase-like glycosyltransferase
MILRVFIEIFGTNEFTARIPSCLFGIITIPSIYIFGRELFSEKEGLVASFIISLSPWYIRWSQEARMYTELTVFTILALFFLYQATNKEKLTSYLLSSIFMTLAFYTHFAAILILGIIVLWLILKKFLDDKRSTINSKHLLAFFGLFFILSIPLVFIAFPQTIVFKSSGREFRWGVGINLYLLYLYGDSIGPTLTLFSVVGAIYLISQRKSAGYLLTAYALVPVVAFATLAFITDVATRYVIFTLPAYALLTAHPLIEIFENVWKGERSKKFQVVLLKNMNLNKFLALGFLFAAVLGLSNLPALYKYYTQEGHPDWKSACAYVDSMRNPEDLIATTGDKVVLLYLGKVDFKLSVELFELSIIDEIKNSHERVWLLLDEQRMEYIDPDLEIRNWLESDCEKMKEVHLIEIYLFTPQNY